MPPFIVSVPAVASVLVVSVSVVCDQVDQVVPAHQVDDIDEVHELDPVHQVDHKDADFCILFSIEFVYKFLQIFYIIFHNW